MPYHEYAIPIVTFILGVIATPVVASLVRRYFDRPRPRILVTDISMSAASGADDTPVQLDYRLRIAESRNLLLPSLDDDLTVGKVLTFIDKSRYTLQMHSELITHLRKLRDEPNITDPALSVDDQRVDLIRRWTQYSHALEILQQMALSQCLDEMPDRYIKPHPDEWKSGERSFIHLSPSTGFVLSEINEDAEYSRVKAEKGEEDARRYKQAVHLTNITRRFWIYLDHTDLRWMFSKVLSVAENVKKDAEQFLLELSQVIEAASPEFLRVQAMVANDGHRSFAIRPFSYLLIPAGELSQGFITVPLSTEGTTSVAASPITVTGNSASRVSFVSEEPLALLTIRDGTGDGKISGETIRNLFQSRVLACRVGLAIIGFGMKQDRLVISDPVNFGRPASDRLKQRLAATLERRTLKAS